ncbi:MAG: Mn2+ or Fe2+ transporter, partial [Actinomycetia bacterium]|nr:Mn2+ or Fe2+ transporter [Actinomycetes bacterium]
LITEGVQVLAGVLLPAATVFLLMLCNDRSVLGPWANGRKTNVFTGAVIAVLITLSMVLTASVLFPAITAGQIEAIMAAGAVTALAVGTGWLIRSATKPGAVPPGTAARLPVSPADKMTWRMPPLSQLPVPVITGARKWGLMGLRGYLAVAMIGVILRIVMLAVH